MKTMMYIKQIWKYKHLLINACKNDWCGLGKMYWCGSSPFKRIKEQFLIIMHPIKHPMVADRYDVTKEFFDNMFDGIFPPTKEKKPIDFEVKDHILK